jgi:hypothetical protein
VPQPPSLAKKVGSQTIYPQLTASRQRTHELVAMAASPWTRTRDAGIDEVDAMQTVLGNISLDSESLLANDQAIFAHLAQETM